METAVDEFLRAACCGGFGERGWVGGYPGDLEFVQKMICLRSEPCWVARLDDGEALMEIAEDCEEGFGDGGVEGRFGWELEEDGA